MTDIELLNQAIDTANELLKKEIHLVLARKNVLYFVNINFLKKDFFHIFGFHYLKDVSDFYFDGRLQNTTLLFKKICNNHLIRSKIINSTKFEENKNRLEAFLMLIDSFLDNNSLSRYFKYLSSAEAVKYSSIKFNYLIKYENNERIIYYFIKHRSENYHQLISVFENYTFDYTNGHTSLHFISSKIIEK